VVDQRRATSRSSVRQPQWCDDKGWNRRRSISLAGCGSVHDRSPASCDAFRQHASPMLTAPPHAPHPPPQSFVPDPLVSSFPHSCPLDWQVASSLSQPGLDPMLVEFACGPASQAVGHASPPVSPPYVPVSQDWLPPSPGGKAQTTSECQYSISHPATEAGKEDGGPHS
jgi:hypothetical protein